MHLYQYLLKHCGLHKKEMHQLLKRGAIRLNNHVIEDSTVEVDGHVHELTINNESIVLPKHHYFMLNKPQGVVSAKSDKSLTTVCDLLDEDVWPIGRLDRNTEGLLLMTDNGQLSFRLPLPEYKVNKVYRVIVNGLLSQKDITVFSKGIEFHGGICCAPAKLDIIRATENESEALVTITEGKFHQIKKMFLTVDLYVTALQRIQYGSLVLDHDLQPGEYRTLTIDEIKVLWDSVQLKY